MADITRAAGPIIAINLLLMALLIAIPALSLWLPGHMN
jgi:TRAP-type C4-dicarboxylate transport system permease large subunit